MDKEMEMDVKYERIELPEEFPFVLTDMKLHPFYSMGASYHWHDCFELSYAKSGSGVYDIEDRRYTIEKGELVIINNVEPHSMHVGRDGLNQLVLIFNPALIWSGSKDLLDYEYMKAFVDRGEGFCNRIAQDNPYFDEVNALIREIEKEFQDKQTGWQLMIKAKLLSLLTLFYRHFKSDTSPAGKRPALLRLQPVLRRIEEGLTSTLDARDMAEILHVTPQHFSVVFKETLGVNFIDYVVSRRIGLAKEKLLTTDVSITRIAGESGFLNLSYFNHAFLKHVGESPSAFRKHRDL
jgi:AraC-like DNA-binding protein/mannose-6-phosphate isomerase-like protein (cupin superfamily)